MTRKTIAIRDIEMSYTERGSGHPLLLLHGGLATAEMNWASRYEALAGYRVIAPDSRGHGRTTNPADHIRYDQMADDMIALVERLGLEQPLVLGYSDGGQIALEMAQKRPGLAKAYVFAATLTEPTDTYINGLHEWGYPAPGEVDLSVLEKSFGAFLDAIKREHKGDGTPDYWRRLLGQISRMWLELPRYSQADLKRITDPALVITGDRDHMADHHQALRLFSVLPHGELAILPNADHSAVEGDDFWSIVLPFLHRQATGEQPQRAW